jgi:hypothetical protein
LSFNHPDPHSLSKLDPDPLSLKKLDPDPHKVNADPNHTGRPASKNLIAVTSTGSQI